MYKVKILAHELTMAVYVVPHICHLINIDFYMNYDCYNTLVILHAVP